MQSPSQHNFAMNPSMPIQRSVFNRDKTLKTSIDQTYLYPIYVEEILPGDSVSLDATFLARLSSPLKYPILDNIYFETFWFYVPWRILWDHWEDFIGSGSEEPDLPATEYELPTVGGDPFTVDELSLGDYFGLPLGDYGTGVDTDPQAGPFRAYNKIWNDWFRPEYIMDKVVENTDDGPDTQTDYTLLQRAKRHDYFTSALPWPQRGDAIVLPLGTSAPVIGNGKTLGFYAGGSTHLGVQSRTGFANVDWSSAIVGANIGAAGGTPYNPASSVVWGVDTDPTKSGLIADLSSATSATINDLREAMQFQALAELDARGGSRYVEQIMTHFGVRPPDYLLQRPQYLGGSSARMDVRSVPQTSPTSGSEYQGRLAGYGITSDTARFHQSFVEHGWIIGLANVRADITYQQGLERFWRRRIREDHYFPILAHLGEQSILQSEIYYSTLTSGNQLNNDVVFGYQERWAEYRYGRSAVTGAMRSQYTTPLDSWHLALDFSAAPALDETFLTDNPPLDRVSAVQNEPKVLLDCFYKSRFARAMPVYSIPANLGRF